MGSKRYSPRIPNRTHGFRTQDLRNVPRGAWWVKQWLQAIDAMRLGARAGRGKVYAEQGQVVSLDVDGCNVEARVLGARPEPYEVKIGFAPFPGDPQDFIDRIGVMSAARICAGEMPTIAIEQFSLAGISPFPVLGKDRFWCSCPDWSKPCKHIAAVLYLLGDALVRDPSLLVRLRGIPLSSGDGASPALPLWKGNERLRDVLSRIYRRTGFQ